MASSICAAPQAVAELASSHRSALEEVARSPSRPPTQGRLEELDEVREPSASLHPFARSACGRPGDAARLAVTTTVTVTPKRVPAHELPHSRRSAAGVDQSPSVADHVVAQQLTASYPAPVHSTSARRQIAPGHSRQMDSPRTCSGAAWSGEERASRGRSAASTSSLRAVATPKSGADVPSAVQTFEGFVRGGRCGGGQTIASQTRERRTAARCRGRAHPTTQ